MHYVLENTSTTTTTLEKEINYIKTYLAIQKLRFNDRVNYIFEISNEDQLSEIRILPLLLQPIVENSILHGLEDSYHNGLITITILIKESSLLIKITDNGVGMNQEQLENVRAKLNFHPPEDSQSIGLYNINQRIHLFYGEPYHLEITSEINIGTTAILEIPKLSV